MTKDELIALLVATKSNKSQSNWGQFIAALNKADSVTKDSIVNAINTDNMAVLINLITLLVRTEKNADIEQDVKTKLAGQNVKIDDLLDIYS